MRHIVHSLNKAQEQLMKAFGCPNDYLIKLLPSCPWCITGDGDMPILSYEHNKTMQNAVIVRHNGGPMIYRSKGFVLVVAIECVKIAFVFDASKELNQ